MRNEIIEEVENFYEQYLYLKDIYNTYLDCAMAEEYSESGKTFLKMASSACIDSYMMTLARLFDEDGKSAKLSEMINKCKQNKSVFENPDDTFAFLTEHARKLKQDKDLKNAVAIIGHRRNKYFAHNDKEYFQHSKETDKVVTDSSYLPSYEIWMLIKWIKELLEKLMQELDTSPSDMQAKYNRDLAELIPAIREHQISPID